MSTSRQPVANTHQQFAPDLQHHSLKNTTVFFSSTKPQWNPDLVFFCIWNSKDLQNRNDIGVQLPRRLSTPFFSQVQMRGKAYGLRTKFFFIAGNLPPSLSRYIRTRTPYNVPPTIPTQTPHTYLCHYTSTLIGFSVSFVGWMENANKWKQVGTYKFWSLARKFKLL
jgi:hypothetical protein